MKKLLLLVIGCCIIVTSWSQQKQRTLLSGRVIDAQTGAPLPGASIVLSDSKVGTNTDSSGHYIFKNIPKGHNLVEISYTGYKTLVEHLDATGNDTVNFALTSSIIENEGVTVTGVVGATSIRKAPVPITRVSKSELLQTPSTNIIDALSRQPGVSQLSTGPAISKPVIRGLGYNRLVVINDGVRQEGQQWGDEHGIEIDENSVSRVEILKGPASLVYGSDAMAGVVNIITTSPAANNTINGSVLSSYQTNNKQRSFFANIGGNQQGFNWNAWGDYKGAADYKNKYDGRVYNSKFNENNYGGYVGYNSTWGYSHFIVSSFNQELGVVEGERDDNGNFIKLLPGGMEATPAKSDFNSTTPQTPYQGVNHLKFILDNSFSLGKGKITLNLGWQRNQRKEFGNVDDPEEKSLYFDLKTLNYNTAYLYDNHKGWTTSIGVGGMQQRNQNKGVEFLIPEYKLFDIGGFVYTQKTIGKTTLSGGLRFDNRDLTSDELMEDGEIKFNAFKKSFANVSGSAGVSYAATENFLVKINLARGFRAPSIPELASNGAHEGTNRYEYGNQDLESETSWQGDLGIELNSEHIHFTASTFYNHIANFIFYSKLSGASGSDSLVEVDGEMIPAFQFRQQTANLVGAEMGVDIHPHPLDWLHWENTLSYVRGTFAEALEGNKNVPFIPATRWISELRWEFLKKGKTVRNLSLHFDIDNTFKQDKPFTAYDTETPTPGYTLLNAGISANLMNHDKTLFSLYLLGNNLTDVAYQNHLSRLKYAEVNPVSGRQGVFNMGRNFVVKLNIPLSFTK
ncbi:TonB-dependent receptor [Chitinophagaceae bacterium LB-8]|uniref:TonB-dependent receptor n=1 Tax=Paraflavisolibacter caeni TaxID=2982496 RepID=A0A9X2XP03_9BACT|nr:TonB-dependent receptor [Paraflavisolibacter caeni]MCU7549569.1 TonB-dependent receptor [Paraflavisolibacter caeni]